MSSFDNKFNFYSSNTPNNEHPSASTSSKPSNTLARIAFNLYGNTQSNNSSATSISPRVKPLTQISSSLSSNRSNDSPAELNQFKYKSGYEMTSFTILNNDSYDQVVLAGKNALQILNIDQNKIQADLLQDCYSVKNKKLMGSILDVSAGYQHFNKYIAASTTTGSILIFDHHAERNRADKLSYKLSDHTRAVNSISFSPLDPHLLISGSQDGAMKLWDLRSSSIKPIITMIGNSDGVRSLKFSPFHNKKFAAIFDSGVIQKWDIRNIQQFERKYNAHTGPGLTIDWHPEFDYIVSGGRDKQIQIWNMNSNDQRQIPDHVIYTASPISKVSFRPIQSNNINGAEIATSFLTNDLGVQVYSLKRKFIPLYHIETHSAQVTGLNFLNERYLLTCSRDKTFIMDDLSIYPPIVSNLSVASTSWAPNGDFMSTNQSIENTEIEEQYEATANQPLSQSHHHANSFSTSPTITTGLSMTTSASVSSVNDSTSPRPGISRASSQFIRPPLTKTYSAGGPNNTQSLGNNYLRNSSVAHQLQNISVINPIIVPVNLPITRSSEVLKYLVDNYRFDSENDLIETCFFNSEVASSVGSLRDSQTWKVIRESLIWESKLEQELVYNETQEVDSNLPNDNESLRSTEVNNEHQMDSDKYNYSTSNSTTYGKSPSLSDVSELAGSKRPSFSYSSYKMSSLKQSILKDGSASAQDLIVEENEDTINDPNKTVTKDDILKWDVDPPKAPITAEALKVEDQEEAVVFTETDTIPILKPRSKRSSMRLITGSASPAGARSISPSYSISSTMSNASQAFFKNRQLPLTKTVIPQPSTLSELTRQLTNHDKIDDLIKEEPNVLLPPFTPRFIIQRVINWNLQQGDLIMSTILIILFNPKYKIYPKNSNILKEIIHGYLEWLQRMKFFVKFSEINKVLVRDGVDLEISKISTTSSGLRHFCSNCGKLIVNEESKAKLQESINTNGSAAETNNFVGSWFCELCSAWNRCIYCNEVLKGLSLIKLKCGHNGHFGCLKSWFLEEGFSECPAGC